MKKKQATAINSKLIETAMRQFIVENHRKCNPLKKSWCLLWILMLFDLVLAYSVPTDIMTRFPVLTATADTLQGVASVLGAMNEETSSQPEVVRFFVLVTLLLSPLKVWAFYRWLNQDRNGVYRFLVISPLTDTKPAEGDTFIMDPIRKELGRSPKNKPRSMFSRVIWSFLIVSFTAGMVWVMLDYFSADINSAHFRQNFTGLMSGGIYMWLEWDIKTVVFASFFVAVSIAIVRDYGIFMVGLVHKMNGVLDRLLEKESE